MSIAVLLLCRLLASCATRLGHASEYHSLHGQMQDMDVCTVCHPQDSADFGALALSSSLVLFLP